MKTDATAAIVVVLGVVVLFGCRSADPAWYDEPIAEREPFRWTQAITVPKKETPGAAKLWYYQAVSGVARDRHGRRFYQNVQASPLDVTILTADNAESAPPTEAG